MRREGETYGKHMRRSRKLKCNVGDQGKTDVHPVAAFVPSRLSRLSELLFRHVALPAVMSVAEPTPLESYGPK